MIDLPMEWFASLPEHPEHFKTTFNTTVNYAVTHRNIIIAIISKMYVQYALVYGENSLKSLKKLYVIYKM